MRVHVVLFVLGCSASALAQNEAPAPSTPAPEASSAPAPTASDSAPVIFTPPAPVSPSVSAAAPAPSAISRVRLGAQLTGALPLGDFATALDLGFNIGVRGGYEIALGTLALTPELALDFARWSTNSRVQALHLDGVNSLQVFAGVRASYLGRTAVPWVGVHLGLDHFGGEGSGCASGCSADKLGMRFSVGTDFVVNTYLQLGPAVAVSLFFADKATDTWFTFGLNGTFRVGE